MVNNNRIWTPEKIILEIQKRFREDKPLNSGDLIKDNNALYVASRVHFGTWRNALIASNIDYDEVMKRKNWTNDSIIEKIRELHDNGVDLSTKNMKKEYRPLYAAACSENHFHSWRVAVQAAGIDYESYLKVQFWDKDKIIKRIIELYDSGEDLSAGSVQKKYNPLAVAAIQERYFGTWKAAVEAAGLDYSKVTKHIFWTKESIKLRINEMYDSGEDLSESSLQVNHPTFYNIIRKHLGSIEKGIIATGLNYDEIRKDSIFEAKLGRYFERYLREMFDLLGMNVEYQKKFRFDQETCILDFFDPVMNKCFEAKIASSTGSIEDSMAKYVSHFPEIEVIFLKGKPRKSKDPRINFVNVNAYYSRIREVKGDELIKKFELLKHGVIPSNNKISNLDNY